MLSNEELKERFKKVHPEYLERDKKGGDKWKQARIFSSVLYPENIDNIDECCNALGVPCSLSPLHDKDLKDADTGELKKPHYHLLVYYKGKITPYAFYSALVGAFGEKAFSTFEIGHDIGALVCYHCHLNNEDKFQYDVREIKDFNGFSSSKYLCENGGDSVENFRKIKSIIKEHNFIFFNDLDDYLDENEPVLYSSFIRDRALNRQVKDYIKSREYQMLYDGEIERSTITEVLPNGQKKQIFNRQIKVV